MAEEKKLQVDVEGFNSAMEAARERSRTAQNKVGILFASVSLYGPKILLSF
jgi:alanyl-tRNA synthetase